MLNGETAGHFTNQQSRITTPAFLPRCMDMISAEDVIRRFEIYFHGGAIRYPTDLERRACEETPLALTATASPISRFAFP